MNKENTTKKGDVFENKVINIIQGLIINDEFYIPPKRSRIFSKKAYFSESRKGDIIVDISIETYLNNTDKYSLLTIIECKNYSKSGVPVDAIEEFDSKLNQIGEHNTKGIMITNSHFQKGAISIAHSKGIGLIRINEKNQIDWINYRKDSRHEFSLDSISTELCADKISNNFSGLYNGKCFTNLPKILIEIGVIDNYENKPKYINLPYFHESEIDNKIRHLGLYEFYSDDKLDTGLICKYLRDSYDISFNFDEDLGFTESYKILGKMTFRPLEISIAKDLKDDNQRWRFTLAHEIGHFILHYDVLKDYFDENVDNELTIKMDTDNLFSYYNKRLEIQANIFASRLLIPQTKLLMLVKDYFIRERIYKGHLHLDWQNCNQTLTLRLLGELQDYFEVSKEAAKIRLISQGLLVDATDLSLKRMLKNI